MTPARRRTCIPTRNAFANAQHATMRQDPDVILVGELRDSETIALAITSAEFSLSTAHSSSRTGNWRIMALLHCR
jgi:Tfp pilus assembly pilus retraction ATPase PilT